MFWVRYIRKTQAKAKIKWGPYSDQYIEVYKTDEIISNFSNRTLNKRAAKAFYKALTMALNYLGKKRGSGGRAKYEYNDGYHRWHAGIHQILRRDNLFKIPAFWIQPPQARRIRKALGTAIKFRIRRKR